MTQELGWVALSILAVVGAACGWLARAAMRRLADQAALERTKGLLAAHLLEFRLFGDEPRLVWRAQRDVARQAWRLMRLVAVPALVVTLPMALVFTRLDTVFGSAALPPGEATVATAEWTASTVPRLEATAGWIVETPAVRASAAQQVSWRVRPRQAGRGELRLLDGANPPRTLTVLAGAGARYPLAFTSGGGSFEIQYPSAEVAGLPWAVWFLVFAAAAYFVLPT